MIKDYPTVESVDKHSDNRFVINIIVTPECDFFKGHFDDVSIFPGIGQIDFTIKMASEVFDIAKSKFQGLPQAKFKRVILPNDKLELHLSRKAGTISFEYIAQDGQSMSSGKVKYA